MADFNVLTPGWSFVNNHPVYGWKFANCSILTSFDHLSCKILVYGWEKDLADPRDGQVSDVSYRHRKETSWDSSFMVLFLRSMYGPCKALH